MVSPSNVLSAPLFRGRMEMGLAPRLFLLHHAWGSDIELLARRVESWPHWVQRLQHERMLQESC